MPFEFYSSVDELIAGLNYSGGGSGSYWHMLKHAERHGFDLAVMKSGIHATLAEEWNGTYSFNDAEERGLVLDLRDRMRLEQFLLPLSETERVEWRWEDTSPSRWYRYTGPSPMDLTKTMTPDQVQAVAAYIRQNYPESVRYLEAIRTHNAPLGFNGGRYDKFIVRQTWHYAFFADAICAIVGDSGDLRVDLHGVEEVLVPFNIK